MPPLITRADPPDSPVARAGSVSLQPEAILEPVSFPARRVARHRIHKIEPTFSRGKDTPLMADFTPTQGGYLSYITAYIQMHGCPPAESEIAAAMCVSPPSVNQMMKTLEKKSLI